MRSRKTEKIFLFLLLAVIFLLNILSIRYKTLTDDESSYHIPYGLRILKLNSDRMPFDSESIVNGTMPFTSLNVIPLKIAQGLRPGSLRSFLYNINTARFITVLFSLLLALYVFKWSKELYGPVAGFFSLIIYAFSPNIIAHSRLVTTDLYSACMVTIACYYFRRFIKYGGWDKAAVSAFSLGLAQLTKYSCLLLYPVFAFIVLVRYRNDCLLLIKGRNLKDLLRQLKIFFKFAVFFVAVGIIIINIGFLFNKSFTPLGNYEFRSDTFKSLQSNLGILKYVPVPVPYPYLEGLDGHEFDEQKGGKQHGLLYLFGKLRKGGGFKGYFFYTFLFKVPIVIQLFLYFSIVSYILKHKRYKFFEDEIFILLPVVFYAIYFNFFFTMHIGIRLFIFIFPLLHVFCGSLFKGWENVSTKSRIGAVSLLAYLILSTMSYFPHFLSYFNELVWDRKKAYKVLADSNLNWGQNRRYLKQYLDKHPDVYIHPDYPTPGRIVVEVNHLVGIFYPEKYRWLRENFEPVDHIAYSYLVYDISPKDLEKIHYRPIRY